MSSCQPVAPQLQRPCIQLEKIYLIPVSLTAGQTKSDFQKIVDSNGDFLWRSILITSATGGSVDLRFRFQTGRDYFLSNVRVPAVLFTRGASAEPFPLLPEIRIEAGGRISMDVTNAGVVTHAAKVFLIGVTEREIQ